MINPKGYRILIKQLPQKQESTSGIIMHSDSEHQRQQKGYNVCEVVAMGEACYKDRGTGDLFIEGMWCGVGDKVYIKNYGGTMISPDELMCFTKDEAKLKELEEMKSQNLSYHLINDDDVMGVIE